MSLAPCRECKAEVSSKALVCPHCGIKKPVRANRHLLAIICVFFGAVLFLNAIGSSNEKQEAKREETHKNAASEVMTIKKTGYFGCTEKDVYEELIKLAVSGDKKAFRIDIINREMSGECIALTEGERVYLDDATFLGLIKIRPEGGIKSYWTDSTATKSE